MINRAMPNELKTGSLTVSDFDVDGSPLTVNDDVAQVMQFVKDADAFVTDNLWKSGWKESDLLYQSPQPFTTFNSAYVLEPNVRRFVIAKDVNSIVPQFTKGLLYEDPPFILKPNQGATKLIADLKRDIMSAFLQKMKFARELKLGMEQLVTLGTGIWQYGIRCEEEVLKKRKYKKVEVANSETPLFSDERPEIERTTVLRYWPFLESCDIGKIYVDPKLSVPDISEASEVAKEKYVNYYDVLELKRDPSYDGLQVSDEIIKGWFGAGQPINAPMGQTAQATQLSNAVMHAQQPSVQSSNPLMNKMRLIEYWNGAETKTILNDIHLIRKMDNPWNKVPFLSANYWNVRENFWGIGVGLIAGGDQRVQAGSIGAALKLLTFKVNAPYMRNADANMYAVSIVSVGVLSNIATIAYSGGGTVSTGDTITLYGLTTKTGFNGATVTVLEATPTYFTCSYVTANYSTTFDTGIAVDLTQSASVSGASAPTFATGIQGVAIDGTVGWICWGNSVQNMGIVAPTSAPTVSITSVPSKPTWAASTYYWPSPLIIDSNTMPYVWNLTTSGTTGIRSHTRFQPQI